MAKSASKGFVAYPGQPREISLAMREAEDLSTCTPLVLETWEKMPSIGLKIDDLIRERISEASVLLADITFSNFNVYYELGYALALERPIIPLLNVAFENAKRHAQSTGIFDTTGWLTYENSNELVDKLRNWTGAAWSGNLTKEKNHTEPLFLLDTLAKINDRNHVVSAIGNSGVNIRSFDPSENPRLTASHAIGEVSSSAGVVVMLLKDHIVGSTENNLRAAFIAGLAHGFNVDTLIIQFDGGPVHIFGLGFCKRDEERGGHAGRHILCFHRH